MQSVEQWNGSNWVYREAYLYQNNAWKSISTILFSNGVDNTAITGGWVSSESGANVTIANGYVQSGAVAYMTLYENNAINLTPYSTLTAKVSTNVTSAATFNLIVAAAKTRSPSIIVQSSNISVSNIDTPIDVSVDVSAVNAAYYIGLKSTPSSSAAHTGRIYEAILI